MQNITATLQTFPIFISCNENISNNFLGCDLQQDCTTFEITVHNIEIGHVYPTHGTAKKKTFSFYHNTPESLAALAMK